MAIGKLGRGNNFLKGTSISYLKTRHRKEKDPKARERLLVYIMRKEGLSIRQIGARTNRCYSTIRKWLVRVRDKGLRGRYDTPHEGRKCYLDEAQIAELIKDLDEGPQAFGFETHLWTAKLAAAHIERRFGVSYTTRAVQYLLRKCGYSWRKLRPRHPKSPSKAMVRALKKSQTDCPQVQQDGLYHPDRGRMHHND